MAINIKILYKDFQLRLTSLKSNSVLFCYLYYILRTVIISSNQDATHYFTYNISETSELLHPCRP